ncbi:hypothetical protein D3C81_2035690 [compost metagenome]
MIIVQKGIQQDVFAIQLAFHKGRGLVAHQHRMAAAFSHHGLCGIAHIVVIQMGQLPNQFIRQTCPGHAGLLACHKFQRAMGPYVENSVGFEFLPEITVEGLILIRREQ